MPSLDRLASWGLLPHSPRSAELSRQIGGTVCCCDPMDRLSRRLYADIGEEYCKVENHAEELLPFLSRYRTLALPNSAFLGPTVLAAISVPRLPLPGLPHGSDCLPAFVLVELNIDWAVDNGPQPWAMLLASRNQLAEVAKINDRR